MKFEAMYNNKLNEWVILYFPSLSSHRLFCHLSESDFEIFKKITSIPIFIKNYLLKFLEYSTDKYNVK